MQPYRHALKKMTYIRDLCPYMITKESDISMLLAAMHSQAIPPESVDRC